jgi:hypothetical protein
MPVSLESLSLDEGIDLLTSKIGSLSRRQYAAMFACIAEALLPLYVRFSDKNGWGDSARLRAALDAALGFALGRGDLRETAADLIDSIAEVTPHEEDFAGPESAFAVDVAICVDAAVRAGDRTQMANPAWVEYALAPAISTVCEQETGYVDLGSSETANSWRLSALKNPKIHKAFEAILEMADLLAAHGDTISTDCLDSLRGFAARLLPS